MVCAKCRTQRSKQYFQPSEHGCQTSWGRWKNAIESSEVILWEAQKATATSRSPLTANLWQYLNFAMTVINIARKRERLLRCYWTNGHALYPKLSDLFISKEDA